MKQQYNRWFFYLTLIACVLAFTVVLLGAYTRLTDAGLGCPDWPGCYGQLVVPESQSALQKAIHAFPKQPVVERKAWTEMIHRYAAGTLGLLIFVLFFISFVKRRYIPRHAFPITFLLVLLVIFQALLGMWTVTEKLLPVVVMGHLLGGMAILALLFLLLLKSKECSFLQKLNEKPTLRILSLVGLFFVIGQIILGGWTSTNYAALACPNFPFCTTEHRFVWDFAAAFHLWTPVGKMSQTGLMTIQMLHRIWGFLTLIYLSFLSITLILLGRNPAYFISGIVLFLLIIGQVTLGLLNVILLLPLPIAVSHNALAALLLLTLVTLCYGVFQKRQNEV